MTDDELRQFEAKNWARVPEADRKRCVDYLRGMLFFPEQETLTREQWLEAIKEPGFHSFTGVAVRNTLRDMLADEELPEVVYPDGSVQQNWDDFYMAALLEALA